MTRHPTSAAAGRPGSAVPGGASAAGFSLVEILVVITLVGLLMGFVVLAVGRHAEAGREADCRARLEALNLMAESYADRTGGYPPCRLDDLGVEGGRAPNEGIEAFTAALRRRDYGGKRPDERWYGNGDGDRADGLAAVDGSDALLELVDPWDNPFVYVTHERYEQPGVVELSSGGGREVVDARVERNPLTGAWHRFDSFQLRSAGADGLLGTEDDLANFELPEPGAAPPRAPSGDGDGGR